TLRRVGWPSSSTLSDPRRLPMVPSSITVHNSLATFCPMRPLKAETPLRLKSASSPCPTASCSRMPGQPGPSTTVISPAGPSPAARESALRWSAVLPRQGCHAHARQWLAVESEQPIAGRDHHLAQVVGIHCLDLKHAGIGRARGAVSALHQLDAIGKTGFGG